MRSLRVACALIASTITSSAVRAEDVPDVDLTPRPSTSMGLPEVLQVAVRQSPDLSRTVVDIDIAKADALVASGLDDYTLSAAGSYSRLPRLTPVGLINGFVDLDELKLRVGISRNLRTGGTVTATGAAANMNGTFQPDVGTDETVRRTQATISLGIDQPALRGFGERIARADERRAMTAREVATLQQSAQALDLTRNIVGAYWKVAYAQQVVEIRKEALKLAVEQLAITQRAIRAGTISPTEELAAQQAIATRQEAALLARVELSQLSLDLRRLAGMEIGRDAIDVTTTTAIGDSRSFDSDATIARALAQNPTLALLDAKAKGAQIDIEVSEDALRPRLDVRASISTNGNSTSTSDAFKQLMTIDAPGYNLGVTYEQTLGNRAAKGAHMRAQAVRRRIQVDLEEARRDVVVSVSHSLDLLRAAQTRIQVIDRAISLARKNLEIEQARFLNGKATNFDVLLRQDELQQARVARGLAAADALAAEATVDALTGDLLGRHHLRIVP